MAKQNRNFYVNGSLAVEIPQWVETREEAKIIVFPGSHQNNCARITLSRSGKQAKIAPVARKLSDILASSEMYCSLRFEDMHGCPYDVFTRAGIASLSAGAGIIAVVSLILGA